MIFQSPSSTGKVPFRCDFPIQKACWLNQEGTKVETSARAEAPAEGAKILPDVRESACAAGGRAANTPKTTRNFNRAKSLIVRIFWGKKFSREER
jgi:hypothetical protein